MGYSLSFPVKDLSYLKIKYDYFQEMLDHPSEEEYNFKDLDANFRKLHISDNITTNFQ